MEKDQVEASEKEEAVFTPESSHVCEDNQKTLDAYQKRLAGE